MIVQDSQTGALHEVPDQLSGYGDYGEVVYDGLGNPVGRLSGIFDDIGKAVGSVVKAIPGVGPVLSNFLPGGNPLGLLSNLLPGGGAAPPTPPGFPQLPFPQLPGTPSFPMAPRFPFRPPWPTGWVRPPLPYTGLGPKRLYMRCAVWPGPQGLVPGFAQNAPPNVPPSASPFMGGRRHHRRRRR
jgi:hypothetical protein